MSTTAGSHDNRRRGASRRPSWLARVEEGREGGPPKIPRRTAGSPDLRAPAPAPRPRSPRPARGCRRPRPLNRRRRRFEAARSGGGRRGAPAARPRSSAGGARRGLGRRPSPSRPPRPWSRARRLRPRPPPGSRRG